MRMTNSMRSDKSCLLICLLILWSCFQLEANSKFLSPEAELSALKDKYPDEPIVSMLQKRDITIHTDKDGLPVINIKETQIEMILSENGADLSEGREYFNSQSTVKRFEAYSLVPDKDRYRKIEVSRFTRSTEFDDYLYFDDTYCELFNFPATGKGVKRCTYTEREIKDPYYPLQFFFGRAIPSENAEVTITMPENVKINFHLFGIDTSSIVASVKKRGKLVTYQWTSRQPEFYKSDILAPGSRYFRLHLIANIASCSTKTDTTHYIGSLNELYGWMDQKISGVNKEISPEVKLMTDSICNGLTDTMQKVSAIYKWVQNNIKYIAIEDGDHGFVPRESSLVLKQRYGDCKGKSSLLTAMIQAIGEKASLAIVGTRELPYKYSEFPSITCGNHMIAVWWNKDKPFILDGTSRNNLPGEIPAGIQGKECIIALGKGQYKLFEIPVADINSNMQLDTIHLSIDHNLLLGYGKSICEGEVRTMFVNRMEGIDKEKQMAFWPAAICTVSDKLMVTDIKVTGINEASHPLNVDFKFELPSYLNRQDNNLYVNLNIERELLEMEVKDDRILPIGVDFLREHQMVYRLKIPDNMEVKYIPAPLVYEHPLFGYSQTYEKSEQEVCLKTKIFLNTLLIERKDLAAFRDMLLSLKKSYRQTITLSEKI